jgi:hypothetical protein
MTHLQAALCLTLALTAAMMLELVAAGPAVLDRETAVSKIEREERCPSCDAKKEKEEVNYCSDSPCLTFETCVNLEDRYDCQCNSTYVGDNYQHNVPSCSPIAAIDAVDGLVIFYKNSNTLMYGEFDGSNFILYFSGGINDDTYASLIGRSPDASFNKDNHAIFFIEGTVEIHDRDLVIVAGYPRSLREELNATPVPCAVTAATFLDNTLYLLQADVMFAYTVTGTAPSLDYTFDRQFVFTENSAQNPFSSSTGSPPSDVNAMGTFVNNGVTTTIAFSLSEGYAFIGGEWSTLTIELDTQGEEICPDLAV